MARNDQTGVHVPRFRRREHDEASRRWLLFHPPRIAVVGAGAERPTRTEVPVAQSRGRVECASCSLSARKRATRREAEAGDHATEMIRTMGDFRLQGDHEKRMEHDDVHVCGVCAGQGQMGSSGAAAHVCVWATSDAVLARYVGAQSPVYTSAPSAT